MKGSNTHIFGLCNTNINLFATMTENFHVKSSHITIISLISHYTSLRWRTYKVFTWKCKYLLMYFTFMLLPVIYTWFITSVYTVRTLFYPKTCCMYTKLFGDSPRTLHSIVVCLFFTYFNFYLSQIDVIIVDE